MGNQAHNTLYDRFRTSFKLFTKTGMINKQMIHEVFILDDTKKILFGNPRLYPENPSYPIHETPEGRLCQLRIKDIILSILYSQFDNFTATKILLDLKFQIQSKLVEIDSKSVKDNYFFLTEMLQSINSIHLSKSKDINKDKIPLSDNNVYIDVVESVRTIISPDNKVINNSIFGHVISTQGDIEKVKILISKPKNFKIITSTSYKIKDNLNTIELSGENIPSNTSIMSYIIHDVKTPILTVNKTGSAYIFTCNPRLTFKSLKIRIPIGSSIFDADIQTSVGTARFDIDEGEVVWSFKNFFFNTESITIDAKGSRNEEFLKPIKIDLNISEWIETGLRIESCKTEAKKIWVHYSTQSCLYEIRQ